MKFTFKKYPKETGLAGVANPWSDTMIKLNKKQVGLIAAPGPYSRHWKVRFTIKKKEPDDNPNCDWKWVESATQFDSEPLAREWVKHNLANIVLYSELHFLED